jgi:E3 ubiquitin-protein ligase UBR4
MQSLRGNQEGHAMDVEAFQRLLVTARSVAVARPQNLVKFANRPAGSDEDKEGKGRFHLLIIVL